eukprot:6179644-Pleurochrysis_carterae.AAC.2
MQHSNGHASTSSKPPSRVFQKPPSNLFSRNHLTLRFQRSHHSDRIMRPRQLKEGTPPDHRAGCTTCTAPAVITQR